MAAAVMPPPALGLIQTSYTPIISRTAALDKDRDAFKPSQHLAFEEMPKVHTMKELGFLETTGVSPIAVSEPFTLFTEEAVLRMREECLSPEVFKNCRFSSNLAHCQLRGFAQKYAPFTYQLWKNPATLEIISKIAGIDVVPQMDWEIGHINVGMELGEQKTKKPRGAVGKAGHESDEEEAIVGWHTDSYPFVCVTMLSDCTNMIGGETALRTGNGDIMKVRGPQMGSAVVLQGRYITHQALRAHGTAERITMVTSFRPRNPSIRDDSVLTTVRPISNLSDLYNQFAEYRLKILEERIRLQLGEIQELCVAGKRVATKKLKDFLEEQEKFLVHMNKEIVDEIDDAVGLN
ncbi:hypothetical protein F4802DRAFT_619828 [Xylaria palmicola]|nr:hypothetical protein F4802DRAFT_619828 [Xylaria palmicola]